PIAHAAAKTDEPVREGVVALLEPFIDTLLICTMTGLVIVITGVWDTKHPANIPFNSADTVIQVDAPYQGVNSLNIVDGIPQNGKVIRYDFSVDTLYANTAQTELFTGVVKLGSAGSLTVAETANGQFVSELNGNVI